MNKTEMRTAIRTKRRALSAEEQRAAAQTVFERICTFEPYKNAGTVMAYMACRGELSLEHVIRNALFSGKTLLLPRCEAPGIMTARRIRSMDDLAPGAYGLPEPRESCAAIVPARIDLILVPGVAFDCAGHRLGQGGGYYDRFLAESSAVRAGICHGFALLDGVPREAHDIRMDYVITPGGIVRAGEDMAGGHEHG